MILHPILKPWGETTRLPMPSGCEIHVARINKGGESSWHHHEKLVNMFYVVKGCLTLEVGDKHKVFDLGEGDTLTVEAGTPHKFKANDDTILIEGYAEVDIHRRQAF